MSTAVLVIVDYTNTSCHSSYVTTSTSQESQVRLGGACRTIHLHACELGMCRIESCAAACLYCRLSVFIHVHGALSAYQVTDIFNSIQTHRIIVHPAREESLSEQHTTLQSCTNMSV